MAVDLTAGVVGILNSGGQIVGTGFMASELGLILTCAHCVIDRDNRRPDKVGIIGVETKREYEAQVIEVGWRDPEAEDIAVLRLVDQRLPNFTPLPLGYSPKDIYEVSIRIFGFARSDSGVWASGKLLGRITSKNGNSLLQINASKISPGFTGAPVLDEATNTVIGMVSAYTSVGQSSRPDEPVFAIPAEVFIPIIQDVSVRINIQIEREAVHTAPEQLRTTSAESDASQSDRSNSLGYSSSTQSAFGWAECCRRELQVPEIPSQYLLAALCQEPHTIGRA